MPPIPDIGLAPQDSAPLFFNRTSTTDMASTFERNKNRTRPTKSPGARRRRQLEQKRRLIALGMDEAEVAKLNPREILTKLKHPAKVAKECAPKG